jgi:hypothetical protein
MLFESIKDVFFNVQNTFSMLSCLQSFPLKTWEVVKIRKDATLRIKYHKYGENLGRGAIGKSNVEAGLDFRGNIWLKIYIISPTKVHL